MKGDFTTGSAHLMDFWGWMNTRHSIFLARKRGEPKPWTRDKIFQTYKFTNVFRQLDKTTVALHKNILDKGKDESLELVLFNVVWFRMFGYIDATNIGFVKSFSQLEKSLNKMVSNGEQIFTGAYMSVGLELGVPKHKSYLEVLEDFWEFRFEALDIIMSGNTLEAAFDLLLNMRAVGNFLAYEMACDLRFTGVLSNATDTLSWTNIGPGAKRGLQRLGLDVNLETMKGLYDLAYREEYFKYAKDSQAGVLFELREIEHSLCEFDKYQRILRGEGRTKGRYPGI